MQKSNLVWCPSALLYDTAANKTWKRRISKLVYEKQKAKLVSRSKRMEAAQETDTEGFLPETGKKHVKNKVGKRALLKKKNER